MNQLPELPEKDLPPGRHLLLKEHLMTEIRQEQHHTTADAPARRRNGWLRPAIAAAAVAAAAAVTFTVLPSSGDSGRPAASKQAVQLLEDIALAAEGADVPGDIRDDQFVYIQSKGAYTTHDYGTEKLAPVREREIWLSVDGSQWGLLEDDREGVGRMTLKPSGGSLEIGGKKVELPQRRDTGRETDYRALSTLPTDPDKMRDWLYRVSSAEVEEERPDKDNAAFVLFGDLIHESLMPPKVSAALYRAAAKIPGVEVVRNVKDSVGREGIAISRESGGVREEQIFDAKTFTYLGEREVDENGKVTGMSAVLERTVVDKAGQRP
ncbi:CU044_5270 family protein [Streptomyces acidicola]|uniref:CU044_5270 family protein n=1 Tax=Streptomyces acidicola TaxID=2596892 RepID=UPI0034245FB8